MISYFIPASIPALIPVAAWCGRSFESTCCWGRMRPYWSDRHARPHLRLLSAIWLVEWSLELSNPRRWGDAVVISREGHQDMKRVTRIALIVLSLAFGMWTDNGPATALDEHPTAKIYCACNCEKPSGEFLVRKNIALAVGADPAACDKYLNAQCISGQEEGILMGCRFVVDRKGVNPEKLKELRKQQKAVPSTTVQ